MRRLFVEKSIHYGLSGQVGGMEYPYYLSLQRFSQLLHIFLLYEKYFNKSFILYKIEGLK